MIAVVGCAKGKVKVRTKMPTEESQQPQMGEWGFGAPASPEGQEDDVIEVSNGGCGFNIAVNLAKMGRDVHFISVVGDDNMGLAVKAELEAAGVKTDGVAIVREVTAVDVEILSVLNDVQMARRNGAAIRAVTPDFLREKAGILDGADIIVVDGTIPKESIEYIAEEYGSREDVKIFFDPGNVYGGGKVGRTMSAFYCVLPGRMEAEAMAGRTVLSQDQIMEAGAFFHEKGIERIIITIKGGGLYYKEGFDEGIIKPERMITFASTSGAGDVVSAAVIAATEDGEDIETTAQIAIDKASEYLKDVKDEKIS